MSNRKGTVAVSNVPGIIGPSPRTKVVLKHCRLPMVHRLPRKQYPWPVRSLNVDLRRFTLGYVHIKRKENSFTGGIVEVCYSELEFTSVANIGEAENKNISHRNPTMLE
jgi:hypothetical protein